MTAQAARRLAERVHAHDLDRYGTPLLAHVRRVAALVPREARTVAWLHEVLESTDLDLDALRAAGAGEDEVLAVQLLTRDPAGDAAAYEEHVRRIADAPGRAGDLARAVKRADLQDRMLHQEPCAAGVPARPPYRRALSVLASAPR